MYIVGDIHGHYSYLVDVSEMVPPKSTIIQVGDFGVGFSYRNVEERRLKSLNTLLAEREQICYVYRGNHDDPMYFNGDCTYSNLVLLPDYSLLEIEGQKCLFVGGAISIDRFDRRDGLDYWSDEGLQLDIDKVQECDILFTHTCGTKQFPQTLSFIVHACAADEAESPYWEGRDLLVELDDEKKKMDQIIEKAKPKFMYYGHFHDSHAEIVEGIHCHLLDIKEVKEHKA